MEKIEFTKPESKELNEEVRIFFFMIRDMEAHMRGIWLFLKPDAIFDT